jgi:hypothetical protein
VLRYILRSRARRVTLWAALIVASVLGLGAPHAVFAGIVSCRADPIVWLSDGESVRMTSEIGAQAATVRAITYTLHVPAGVTATKIVYTGGVLQSKERVVLVADQLPHTYVMDTLVDSHASASVNATSAMTSNRHTVSGKSRQHLIINLKN